MGWASLCLGFPSCSLSGPGSRPFTRFLRQIHARWPCTSSPARQAAAAVAMLPTNRPELSGSEKEALLSRWSQAGLLGGVRLASSAAAGTRFQAAARLSSAFWPLAILELWSSGHQATGKSQMPPRPGCHVASAFVSSA